VRRDRGQWLGADGTALLAADGTGPAERVLGIRPEDIALDGADTSVGVVRIVEYIGPTTTLLVDWAGDQVHIVVPCRSPLQPGDRVQPRIDGARAVFFDPQSPGTSPSPDPETPLAPALPRRREPGRSASHPSTKEMP
jgi:hypothetical protein